MNFLNRLLVKRRQVVTPLDETERIKLLAQVADNDAAMRVVFDVLTECVEAEFQAAIAQVDDVNKLRAVERMRTAWMLGRNLEEDWNRAKEWRRRKEQGE